MNFDKNAADEAFREEVRAFLAEHLPLQQEGLPFQRPTSSRDEIIRWTRLLKNKGWLAPGWSAEWGGRNLSPTQIYILMEEMTRARCPDNDYIGLNLVGPVIHKFGTLEQKRHYLPRILNADDFWCQGFSEPQAGSDLSLVQTKAVRDGNHYIVNGHKIWTTQGHNANMMFALVRITAGGRMQPGVSFLLLSMHAPGVKVRPIITIDGGHSVNEVFLENVRVPTWNLIGEEGRGWVYARFLLGNERAMVSGAPQTRRDLDMVKYISEREMSGGQRLIEDTLFRSKIAQLEIDLVALEYLVQRLLNMPEDHPDGERLAPILKIRGAELQQRVSELAMQALGDHGLAFYPQQHKDQASDGLMPLGPSYASGATAAFMFRRSATIAAGSNEIQRNILATTVLGL